MSLAALEGMTENLKGAAISLAEGGRLPDPVVAAGVRWLLRGRLRAQSDAGPDALAGRANPAGAIAVDTEAANRQHYDVPAAFFRAALGRRLKYSCCQWDEDARTLDDAELRMLELTARRADLHRRQRVLDLGCGWGSFSLYAAARWPDSRFLAVSNSRSQIEFVRGEARRLGLHNLEARVADVNTFEPEQRFDRIVSVEMLEHVRRHAALFERIARWLRPDGRMFVHVFCHRHHAYPFEARGAGDWMARQFFTGGVMPSEGTIPAAAAPRFELEESWRVAGGHYARTADAWLANLDARRHEAAGALAAAGDPQPELAIRRWRLFFLAVRETFGFADGGEWGVMHYRLRPRPGAV